MKTAAGVSPHLNVYASGAFPVVLGPRLFGVFEFFGAGVRPKDEELLRTMSAIGSQIGQFVERTRAEQKSERDGMSEHTTGHGDTSTLRAQPETYRPVVMV